MRERQGGREKERWRIVLIDKETSDKNNHIRGTKEASELFLRGMFQTQERKRERFISQN